MEKSVDAEYEVNVIFLAWKSNYSKFSYIYLRKVDFGVRLNKDLNLNREKLLCE